MDYLLWARDNVGYLILGVVVIFFAVRALVVWINKRKKPAQQQQQMYSQQYNQPQPYGPVPPMGAYDNNINLIQQKAYIEDQLKEIEREGKMIADEMNILDGNYQSQKITLNSKRQGSILKYSMWKKHLDEVNAMLGPQACRQAENNRFQKLGELR